MNLIRRSAAMLLCLFLVLNMAAASAAGFTMVSIDQTDAQLNVRGYVKHEGYVYMNFGSYPYTAEGEVQPILWDVLFVENDKALLFTHYIIDFAQYHTERADMPTWKDYAIYHTLNEEMVPVMFTPDELSAIIYNEDMGWIYYPSTGDMWNIDYGFRAGHWPHKERECRATPYAKASPNAWISHENGNSWYYTTSVPRRCCHGLVGYDGHTSVAANNRYGGVRPLCWVDLTKLDHMTGTGTLEDPFCFEITASAE